MVATPSLAGSREKLGGHSYKKEDLANMLPGQFFPVLEKAHKNEVVASHCSLQPKTSANKAINKGKPNSCDAYQHSASSTVDLLANSSSSHPITYHYSPAATRPRFGKKGKKTSQLLFSLECGNSRLSLGKRKECR